MSYFLSNQMMVRSGLMIGANQVPAILLASTIRPLSDSAAA